MDNTCSSLLEIYTLGHFLLQSEKVIFSRKALRSNKMWELFKFMLSHRGKTLPPETILEHLWPEKEYADPRAALRVQINRMKHAIGEELFSEGKLHIYYSHGCYCMETGPGCQVDTDVMESLSRQAAEIAPLHPEEAIETYYRAISLYRGDYFPDISYHSWVLPYRNYYRRLFLMSVLNLIKLLRETKRNAEIISLCEKTFFLEIFEEELHLHYMKALKEEGQGLQALTHYRYITTLMYREIGAKPSEAMRNMYRLLKADHGDPETNQDDFLVSLQEQEESEGPFFCDPDFFRLLYRLERRRSQRNSREILLVMLSVTDSGFKLLSPVNLEKAVSCLRQELSSSLRRGDAITRWNDSQFMVLLPCKNSSAGEEILDRIKKRFYHKLKVDNVSLHYKLLLL